MKVGLSLSRSQAVCMSSSSRSGVARSCAAGSSAIVRDTSHSSEMRRNCASCAWSTSIGATMVLDCGCTVTSASCSRRNSASLRPTRVAALVIGFVGIIVVVRPDAVPDGAGAVLALGSALGLAAVALVLKFTGGHDSPSRIVWLNLVISVPIGLAMSVPVWATPSPLALGLMALQGAGGLAAQLAVTQRDEPRRRLAPRRRRLHPPAARRQPSAFSSSARRSSSPSSPAAASSSARSSCSSPASGGWPAARTARSPAPGRRR